MVSIGTILDWFKAGKKPTQQQFEDSWQSFWHKEEKIPQSTIQNLAESFEAKFGRSSYGSMDCNLAPDGIHTDYIWQNAPSPGIASLTTIVYSPDWKEQTYTLIEAANFSWRRFFVSGTTWTEWTIIIAQETLNIKSDIPNETNLDLYTKTGIFIQRLNIYASAGLNYPVGLAGKLEVVSQPAFVYQTYHTYGNSNTIYYRSFYSEEGWSPWKMIADDSNLIHKNGNETKTGSLELKSVYDTYSLHTMGNNQNNGIALGTLSNNRASLQGYKDNFTDINAIYAQPEGGNFVIGNTPDSGDRLQVDGNILIHEQNGGPFTTKAKGDGIDIVVSQQSGGWARGYSVLDENYNPYLVLATLGNGQDFTYNFLGKSYDNSILKFTGDKVGIGIPSTGSPQYNLDVRGTAFFNEPMIIQEPSESNHAATKNFVDESLHKTFRRYPTQYTTIDCNHAKDGIITGYLWDNAPLNIPAIASLTTIIYQEDWQEQTFTDINIENWTWKRFYKATGWTEWKSINAILTDNVLNLDADFQLTDEHYGSNGTTSIYADSTNDVIVYLPETIINGMTFNFFKTDNVGSLYIKSAYSEIIGINGGQTISIENQYGTAIIKTAMGKYWIFS